MTPDGGRRKIAVELTTIAVGEGRSGMAQRIPSLGELEIRVLRLVWRHQPCTERQISELVRSDRPVARGIIAMSPEPACRRQGSLGYWR